MVLRLQVKIAERSNECLWYFAIFGRGQSIYESIVGFVPVSDLSAAGLSSELISQMQKLGLDYKAKLIG